ncbi:helix-turn-helix transcriptional regulator [Streptomyces canus]|uniref:helix-turn-helix domain-containing protein n=1 Tax=Streptomyces canus TaxID=58343 RepID=UPI002DDAF48F|nr:helix-turn-helix transcriptional regulator [Streptomyces canus]WSD82916.1 helix-turn-helix domain-containing protein [Streptomyces canus]WSD91918.1 helix-turn-helix domain-containing protein [Streptomyces canus]WSD92593.1 helix-turn-helix domain-containing protein [Streptomyces canus]
MLTPDQSPQHRLGYMIRELREARGLSMREFAARTFVSHSKVQRWENGARPPQDRGEAELIDRTLGAGGFLIELWQEIDQGVSEPSHVSGSAPHVSDTPVSLATALSHTAPSDSEGIFVPARLDDGTVVLVALDRRALLRAGVGVGAAAVAGMGMPAAAAISASEDPFGFARTATENWSGLQLSRPTPDFGVDWHALIPGGRSMLGSQLSLQVHPARIEGGRVIVSIPNQQRTEEFLTRPHRSLLVGAVNAEGVSRFYALDGRSARSKLARNGGVYEVAAPTAYELDDLTYGILWAVSNYDDALQADDQPLAETRSDLKAYERLSASAVSREAAPGLNTVAHMWLGSDFCARHILRTLPDLPALPAFWTREQRGEEASAWLIFDHKYPYLRETTKALGSTSTRAFCIPEEVVRSSPRYERILLFLAVALMESLGIHAQFTSDPAYESVEGFVVSPDREAVIANWVRGDGMWHVDVTARSSVVREFTIAARDVDADSLTAAPTAAGRLRALAQYLDLPWSWLIQRCGQLARYGSSGLIQSRSRLVSAAGIDAACAYVASLPTDH